MSKERKIDDSELADVSGAGGIGDIAPDRPEADPNTPGGSVKTGGSGGTGPDDPEPQPGGPGYQDYGQG